MNPNPYYHSLANGPGMILLVYGITLLIIFAISLVAYVFEAICYMKLFKKAYEEPWKAWIPFLNQYVICKLVFGNGWLFLLTFLTFIPYIGSLAVGVFLIYRYWKLAEVYGKGIGTFFGLWFLPIVFLPYLAFGDSEYYEEKANFLNGIF